MFEYTNLSFAYSVKTSPVTGYLNVGSTLFLSSVLSVLFLFWFSVSFDFLGSNYQYIIIFFCRFLVHLVYNILRVLTNFHYSPAHRVIPKTFRSFIVWLWAFIPFFGSNASEPFLINLGTLASYLFQMIGVLIFVEVLIISVFGIDKNIEEEITRREMSEFNNRIDGLIVTTKEEEDDKPIELAWIVY